MSSSSRKRRLVTPQQPDDKRRTDRIVVDVGGTRFTTSASTLTSSSEYFGRLLSPRWCAEPPEEIFIDRDPEPFAILLTYMRTGLLELSKDDPSMARRVMVEAEFLGMQGFIDSVKVEAIKNHCHGSYPDRDAVEGFDRLHGSFDAAIRDGILPKNFFPPPPPGPPRKIVQLLPAPPGTRAEIHFEDKDPDDPEDDGDYSEWFDVLCFVLHDRPIRLKEGSWDFVSALDAYVAHHPSGGDPRLASEAYSEVTSYKFHLPPKNGITDIPPGFLDAEYWKDVDDHSAGTVTRPVRMVRGNLDLDLNQGNFHPVELVQRDHDGKKLEWKELASYANFKGFIGYCS
jgi:hypothetical protein